MGGKFWDSVDGQKGPKFIFWASSNLECFLVVHFGKSSRRHAHKKWINFFRVRSYNPSNSQDIL